MTSEEIGGIYTKTINRTYSDSGFKGRYTGMNIGGEYGVNYGYDNYGRVNGIVSGENSFAYDYLANSDAAASMSAAVNGTPVLSRVFTYEPHRNLISRVENKHGANVISGFTYANDAIGRRQHVLRDGSAFTQPDFYKWAYNTRSEVIDAKQYFGADAADLASPVSAYDYGFAYDNIGNRSTARIGELETIYTSNNLNQYTAINTPQGTALPTYDADGNMLTNGNWAYTWNGENRLIVAESADKKLEFAYDYMGRRVEKKVYSGSVGNWTLSKHERFVYDGYKCIEVLDALNSNTITKKFVWQPENLGLDVVLSMTDSEVTTYFYTHDANKNTSELIDATGTIRAHYEYSPFGKTTVQTGDKAAINPFRFSSEFHDTETALVYYNFRYYSPELGRWTKRDPINEKDGENLQAMLRNNAVNKFDRLGLAGASAAMYRRPPSTPGSSGGGASSNGTTSACGEQCCGDQIFNPSINGCCNHQLYSPKTHCCCDGKRKRREPIDSGIKKCCHYTWYGTTEHCWVSMSGGVNYGFYPVAREFEEMMGGKGEIKNETKGNHLAPTEGYVQCQNVLVSECEFDLKSLRNCIRNFPKVITTPNYTLGSFDCRHFATQTISICLKLNVARNCK